jgi:hypothetical protein
VANSTICPPFLRFTNWFYDKETNSITVVNGATLNYFETSIMFRVNLTNGDKTLIRSHTDASNTTVSREQSFYRFPRIESPENILSARDSSTNFFDESLRSFFIYGGYYWETDKNLGDLWRYNVTSGMWAWLHGTNQLNSLGNGNGNVSQSELFPACRSNPGWTYDQEKRILYFNGGYTEYVASADVWSYSVDDNIFTMLGGVQGYVGTAVYGAPGEYGPSFIPQARYGNSLVLNSTSQILYMTHGSSKTGNVLADFWGFDLKTRQFGWIYGVFQYNVAGNAGLKGVIAPTNLPPAMLYLFGFYSRSRMYLFGGKRSSTYYNTVWEFLDDGMAYQGPNSNSNSNITLSRTFTSSSTRTVATTSAAVDDTVKSANAGAGVAQFNWQLVAAISAGGVVLVLAVVVITVFQLKKKSMSSTTGQSSYGATATTATGTITASTAYQTSPTTMYGNTSAMAQNPTEFGNVA